LAKRYFILFYFIFIILSSPLSPLSFCPHSLKTNLLTPCVPQIRTAMNAGAHGVIVVDNIDQPNVFLMTDGLSGSAPEVTIPSILINRTIGEQLKLALLEAGTSLLSLSYFPSLLSPISLFASTCNSNKE
jgi:hypothetical protein